MGAPKRRKSELEKITWTSVNIDKRMVEAIRRIITKVYGYKSVADYVQDAVRRKIVSSVQVRVPKRMAA